MLILTAIRDNMEMFTITCHMTREQLMFLRNASQFTCPQCENPLRLKIGKVVTPHFAHIVLTNCLTSFSERESPTHLIGKQQLAEFFIQVGCEVSVEAYLPKIAQRPDLLVRKNNKLRAIEFQCSVISIEEVARRNKGYKKIGVTAIWLVRTPINMQDNKSGISYMKLSKFMQSFIHADPISGDTLITYDPTTSQFVYLTQLLHISGTSFITKVRALSIEQQTFPFAQVKSLTDSERIEYWRIYQDNRTRYLRNRIFTSKYGARDRFLRNCYEQQIRPEKLPLYIGLPIHQSEAMQDHPIEWQLALICALSRNKVDMRYISTEWIEAFIETKCKVFHLENAIQVVKRYCQRLHELDYDSNQSISQQPIREDSVIDQFQKVLVAKPFEN